MKDPTAEAHPLDRLTALAENVVRFIAWGMQAAAAVTYLVITAHPTAWQTMYAKAPFSVLLFLLFSAVMAFVWGASLWEEARRFYDRGCQRLHRRAGLVGHGSVVLIAAVAASQEPERLGLWIGLGVMAFTATAVWAVWMQAQLLPEDDQAVIDTIIAREAAGRIAAHQTIERERRRRRLTAIVESLGYTITQPAPPASTPAGDPLVRWTIPKGKHAPLVYFIRNGNRMKIGTTTALGRRIRALALRDENVALLVPGDQRREHEYHKRFAALRVGNTEWFADEGALADYVTDQITRHAQNGQGQ